MQDNIGDPHRQIAGVIAVPVRFPGIIPIAHGLRSPTIGLLQYLLCDERLVRP